jgi:uncharacterized protein
MHWLIVLLLVLLAVPVRQSAAASFDCAKAGTAVEKMICADPALSGADEALGDAYAAALAAVLDRRALRVEQLEWLRTRERASSAAAMLTSYRQRVDALRGTAERWRAVPKEVAATTARTSCLVLPDAPDGSTCAVQEFAAVDEAAEPTLFYQLQSYADVDRTVGAGVVVYRTIPGKAGMLIPLVALASEGAHYQAPDIHTTPVARWMIIPGELEGTGHLNAETIYLIGKGGLEDVDADGWLQDLGRRLPKGMTANKGIFPDYRTMTAETPLWRSGDGNCCPTGGPRVRHAGARRPSLGGQGGDGEARRGGGARRGAHGRRGRRTDRQRCRLDRGVRRAGHRRARCRELPRRSGRG